MIILNQSKQKQPPLLWAMSICYSLFMWAFCSLIASLTLYLTSLPGVTLKQSYAIFAAYSSLLWILPLLGGWLCEKTGFFPAAKVGLAACIAGIILLCFAHSWEIYFSLALFLIGNSLFTPSLWCLVDHLYQKEDSQREAGFTLFYIIFNIGSVLGIFFNSFIGAKTGYQVEFIISASILALAFIVLHYCYKNFTVAAGRSIVPQIKSSKKKIYTGLLGFCLLAAPCVTSLLLHTTLNVVVTYIIGISAVFILLRLAKQQPLLNQKHKIYGFIVLCFFAMGFWILYNLEPSLLSVFIKQYVNPKVLSYTLPADAFFGFEALSIVIVGLFLSRLWLRLAKSNKDPSLAIKFGLALIIIGGGYLYLYFLCHAYGLGHQIPAIAIICSYLLFATGELFIGPLGISMVGKLSPEGKEGLFMGGWQLVVGIGAIVSGWVAGFSLPSAGSVHHQSEALFSHLFEQIGLLIIAAGIVVLLLSPWVKSLLGDKQSTSLECQSELADPNNG